MVLPRHVLKYEVVVLELFVPSGGASVQFPWGLPVEKIGMVSVYDEWFLCPYQVWSPMCYGFYYGQEFSFVYIIVPFCGCEGCRIVRDRMLFGLLRVSGVGFSLL